MNVRLHLQNKKEISKQTKKKKTTTTTDHATSKIYIIIGICSAVVMVIGLSAVGIFVSKRRKKGVS
jgi:hypothetical protein